MVSKKGFIFADGPGYHGAMRPQIFLLTLCIGVSWTCAVWAKAPDPPELAKAGSTPTPMVSVEPTPAATPLRAPQPAPTPLRAPESAPTEAYVPGHAPPKKSDHSGWKSLFDFGVGVPLSAQFPNAYNMGFNVEIGEGYQFTDLFSGWVNVDIASFGSRNDALTGGNSYTLISVALWARYRLIPGALSPYFFAGPGLAYNEIRSNTSNGYSYYTGGLNFPVSGSEIDFLLEGGGGIELGVSKEMTVFLQGKLSYDFLSQNFAGATAADSPFVLLPLQAGVIFGI